MSENFLMITVPVSYVRILIKVRYYFNENGIIKKKHQLLIYLEDKMNRERMSYHLSGKFSHDK